MTVVVGVRHRNGVVLAADSRITDERTGSVRTMRGVKTASLSETVAIAGCGSPRVTQVIEYGVKLDEDTNPKLGEDELRWAINLFVPNVIEALSHAGALEIGIHDEVIRLGPSAFLLAVRDRVFSVVDDFQVNEDHVPWVTEGSGWEVAGGHLTALGWDDAQDLVEEEAEDAAVQACETAAKLNAYVASPVTVERTVRLTEEERDLIRELSE